MSDARDQFYRKQSMATHLAQLAELLEKKPTEDDLLSLEETRSVQARARLVTRVPSTKNETPFDFRNAVRFRELVLRLSERVDALVYLWTPLSNVCGLLRPVALRDVRFSFRFDIYPEGILNILTEDLMQEMVLDFFLQDGQERLELELSGSEWGSISVVP